MADSLVFNPYTDSKPDPQPSRPMKKLPVRPAGEGGAAAPTPPQPTGPPAVEDAGFEPVSFEDFDNAGGSTVAGVSSEQMGNARAIAAAGRSMGLSERDIKIGIMTALGESSLRVVNHGDQAGPDSRGLFQQRANGAWGSLIDRMDPTISATNFFKALTRVSGRDGMAPTMVAHKVQRNADANHYTRSWDTANKIYAALSSGSGRDGGSRGGGNGIVTEALRWVGTPYKWGGTGPLGFDCSGFTQYVYARMGISIPRVSYQQANGGTTISRNQMQAGDLVSWDNSPRNNGADHIGIYLGNGRFVSAPKPGDRVKIQRLYGNYRVTRYGRG